MQTKILELRDKATFIPIVVMKLQRNHLEFNEAENYLLGRAGFGGEGAILITRLEGGKAEYDPYSWADRTFQAAHLFIERNFDSIETGSVIDVEFILGEASRPKFSERLF